MMVLISPAKSLDFTSPLELDQHSLPLLQNMSQELIKICRKFTSLDLMKLMKVSENIANTNVLRFKNWSDNASCANARQAILAFTGDVYTGMNARTFTNDNFAYAQENLRILSGLYGILRPLDLIQAYRLEMGTKLQNDKGNSLYKFWGDKITDLLNEQLAHRPEKTVVNLASNEYFSVINTKRLNAQVITPVFYDQKNGQYKIISLYAKKARGMMSRYIIEHEITSTDALTKFNVAGYYFDLQNSDQATLIFKRDAAINNGKA